MLFVIDYRPSCGIPKIDVLAYAAAQQIQLREHYASCYDGDGCNDDVVVVDRTDDPPDAVTAPSMRSGRFVIRLETTKPADIEGALGVHELGVCRVFLAIAQETGDPWTAIASHEVLEARADPRLHACVELDNGEIWDREICDRCEADNVLVTIANFAGDSEPPRVVLLSNFNTPACFEPTGEEGEFFDWLKLSTRPNEVRPGGYAQRLSPGSGWIQVGAMRPYRARLASAQMSRGARRAARAHFGMARP